MFLGDIIKEYRIIHQMSLRAFANRCGLSYTYISMLEKNKDYRTGKPIAPTLESVKAIANAMNISIDELLKTLDDEQTFTIINNKANLVNVYSSVHAGILSEMIENIVDTEEISEKMANSDKTYFGIKVKGDSMSPKYLENDTIIIEKTNNCENGQDCIVAINGNEAFLKRVFINENGITLQALNPNYEPLIYTNEQIKKMPVTIIGIVRELRRKI